MHKRHMLTLTEIGNEELERITARSVELAAAGATAPTLDGRIVGIYFRKPSTRTRSSFASGALRLGAGVLTFGPDDLQLTTGETLKDTARVLSGYLDALVVRSNGSLDEMRTLSRQGRMALVNAMSECEHPTQAIADLSTLREHFGRLDQLHVLYVGEGNNTASALAYAVARTPGMRITFATPPGYALPDDVVALAAETARANGADVRHMHGADDLPTGVDVVYATRWQTMGVPHPDPDWKGAFRPYRVTAELLERVGHADTVFMHDLPAVRGEDVDDDVLDGERSLAWRQAEHKMFGAMAVLEWCLAEGI